MNAYVNQYKNNHILSASPEQILIMLYDGAIRFNRQAQQALDDGDKLELRIKTNRCSAILAEFSNTLDHKVGGEIAENLDALYAFMQRELARAGVENDRKAFETVDSILCELREAWVEAALVHKRETQTSQPSLVPKSPQDEAPLPSFSAAF